MAMLRPKIRFRDEREITMAAAFFFAAALLENSSDTSLSCGMT